MTVLRLIAEPETSQHREVLCDWITAHGVDPRDVVAPTWISIERHDDGTDHIHYRGYKRFEDGSGVIDPEDSDRAWTELRSVPLTMELPPPLGTGTVIAPKQAQEAHGTGDSYPYGGNYDEGIDYVIHCYCGAEFTGELDGTVENEFQGHLDRVEAGDE